MEKIVSTLKLFHFGFVPLALLCGLLTACDNTQEQQAQISISLSAPSQALAMATAADTSTGLSKQINRLPIIIENVKNEQVATGDLLLARGDRLRLSVPPGILLRVVGRAYAGEELVYEGETHVDALQPGKTSHVSLQLQPAGAITAKVITTTHMLDATADNTPGDEPSGLAVFSRDNRLVAFHSQAGNLTASGNSQAKQMNVLVKDLVADVISNDHTDKNGTLAIGELTFADMTGDGKFLVFSSRATNLVDNDNNNKADIFLKDRAGPIHRLSILANNQGELSADSLYPAISRDGKAVTFYSDASLTNDGKVGVFLIEQPNNANFSRIHVGDGWRSRISGDGKWIIYRGHQSNDLWLYDVANHSLGAKPLLVYSNDENNAAAQPSHHINFDGNYIVFDTFDSFDPQDGNDALDVYLLRRDKLTLKLLSADRDNHPLTGVAAGAIAPSLSDDGHYVAFNYGDTIYVKDALNGDILPLADAGNNAVISPDGNLVAYNGKDGHLYLAPNPLLIQTPPDTQPVAPVEQPVPGSRPTLIIVKAGNGSGTVKGDGIDCGATCSVVFSSATSVNLFAGAQPDSAFAGWSGACSGNGTDTTVLVNAVLTCTATFNLFTSPNSIGINPSGDGGGSVTSDDGNINCSGTSDACYAEYAAVQNVALTATADANSTFEGWNGACGTSKTNPITIAADGHKTCGAVFQAKTFPLDLTLKGGPKGGTVTSSDGPPPTLNCNNINSTEALCSANFARNASVNLVATPDPNGFRDGVTWTGCNTANGFNCNVVMNKGQAVTATFVSSSHQLTITGHTGGTVSETANSPNSPFQIDCGANCSGTYIYNSVVTLKAAPLVSTTETWRFDHWSGDCSGTTPEVNITIKTRDLSCAAVFVQQFTLTITPPDLTTGGGSIVSDPVGITCSTPPAAGGNVCSKAFDVNQVVKLAATPAPSFVFDSWSGDAGCGASVTMTRNLTCTAVFKLQLPLITAASPFTTQPQIGVNLQELYAVKLATVPATSVPITITSSNANVSLVALADAATAGSQSLQIDSGPSAGPFQFYIQGLSNGTGTAASTLTVSAPGYADLLINATVTPAGFVITAPQDPPVTVPPTPALTINVGDTLPIDVQPARLNADRSYAGNGALRGGLDTVNVNLSATGNRQLVSFSPATLSFSSALPSKQTSTLTANVATPPSGITVSIATPTTPAGFVTPLTLQSFSLHIN